MFVYALAINAVLSLIAFVVALRVIPQCFDIFIKANLYGIDLCKNNKKKVPEALGVVVGCIYLVTMFLYTPVTLSMFNSSLFTEVTGPMSIRAIAERTWAQLDFYAILLAYCSMLALGFVDDVVNLRWRFKIIFPALAAIPVLIHYIINKESTTILMPKILQSYFGTSVDIGWFYYIYMIMLCIFCTNAINIYAGINGLEIGQTIIISINLLIFSCIEMYLDHQKNKHFIVICHNMPLIALQFAIFYYNKYPAQAFPGDTFCYCHGMAIASFGIVGHFSKTVLLFLIPQIFNFLYSCPQLFHMLPCPRHRLPKYDERTDLLHISTIQFKLEELNPLGRLIVKILRLLRLISYVEKPDGSVIMNNLTLINLMMVYFGPVHEKVLTNMLLTLQVITGLVAFTIRYPMAGFFYET